MIKSWMVAGLLAIVCIMVYWPHQKAEFVLDDYYTVVRDPLIKNPSLYAKIWTSRLFDAHQSSGYIKFGYYRPVLQSSFILDYRLFGLNASGYQWINLLIHGLNCLLVYILLFQVFGQSSLALKSSLLFCVLPSQEWVVRYVTGRGDELSVLFALGALILIEGGQSMTGRARLVGLRLIPIIFLWVLAELTREVALSYILCASIVISFGNLKRDESISKSINIFSLYWVLIGLLPIVLLLSIIPKQGNILCWHLFYFGSVGLCVWLAQWRLRYFVILFALSAGISLYQGQFWTTEKALLNHTRSLELWPGTVADQQVLMKYDNDIPAINEMVNQSRNAFVKGMWLRRLGSVYFDRGDLSYAQKIFLQAFAFNPSDLDTINAMAVVYMKEGQENQGLDLLNHALKLNPSFSDTLKNLGLYYYLHKDYTRAQSFLSRCLSFDPDNIQAAQLLRLAKAAN